MRQNLQDSAPGDAAHREESEAFGRLRTMVEQLDGLLDDLEVRVLGNASATAEKLEELEPLTGKVKELEEDRDELVQRLIEAEQHASRLMALYVATYDLHASLEPTEVQAAIADIALNLLGANWVLLLLSTESEDNHCEVVLLVGPDPGHLFKGGKYQGGDSMIDATLSDGSMRIGQEVEGGPLAVVPLTVQGFTVGALVILGLLSHKPSFGEHDREMLDLIGAHAASALFAARVYTTTDSKLRTLEGLLNLLRQK